MTRKAKHTLFFEESYDFDMFGICCHQSDYRLVWAINERLELKLSKAPEAFMVSGKNGEVASAHSFYEWFDEELNLSYYLIKNKALQYLLIPEKAQVDYFLIVKDKGQIDVDDFLTKIKEISSVLTVILIDPLELKSRSKLVF